MIHSQVVTTEFDSFVVTAFLVSSIGIALCLILWPFQPRPTILEKTLFALICLILWCAALFIVFIALYRK